jgi:hypothetical protein
MRYMVKTETHLVRYTMVEAENEGVAYAIAIDFHVDDISDWDEVIGATNGVWCSPEDPHAPGHDAELLEEANEYSIGGPFKQSASFPGYEYEPLYGKSGSYFCADCGWSRVILDGETIDDARKAHEGTDIHHIDHLRTEPR